MSLNKMFDIKKKIQRLQEVDAIRVYGNISRITGLTVNSQGPPCSIGDFLKFENNNNTLLQVVGFNAETIFSMPLGSMNGITSGQKIYSTGLKPSVNVGFNCLGRIINGLGRPIDGKGPIEFETTLPINKQSVNAMHRENIKDMILTGIKSIDGLTPLGKGQRMGVFSGSGVGKSTLMGMIARNTNADVNVISLVGERGRELKDFIEKSLGPEGLSRSVVIAATSDEPPLIKINSAFLATTIAEYFSDQGKDVMLMMDSITRLSMAQREVGLSIGEPPSSKGYTPSVFTMMPKLLERAGNFTNKGSITGIYTVLVEGDDVSEPISDHARSILDGHIVLSRDLAHKNQFPAIDVLESVSRVSSDIIDAEHNRAAGNFRELLAVFRDAEDLINIGAYVKGSNPKIDLAISKITEMRSFLKQSVNEKIDFQMSLKQLKDICLESLG